jgi:hypothetical protein
MKKLNPIDKRGNPKKSIFDQSKNSTKEFSSIKTKSYWSFIHQQ